MADGRISHSKSKALNLNQKAAAQRAEPNTCPLIRIRHFDTPYLPPNEPPIHNFIRHFYNTILCHIGFVLSLISDYGELAFKPPLKMRRRCLANRCSSPSGHRYSTNCAHLLRAQ